MKTNRLFKNVCEDSALDTAIDWVLETPSGFADEDLLHQAGKDDLIARVKALIADPATDWSRCWPPLMRCGFKRRTCRTRSFTP